MFSPLKFFKNMFQASESSLLQAETFYASYRKAKLHTERKQVIVDYLTKHFENDSHPKVTDFPANSEWINSTKPLSIHKDLQKKVVLMDFFTYCCINCMHILPDLKILEHKFSVEDGLVVIGVHYAKFTNEKQTGNVVSAVKRYGINHAVINDSKGFVWDNFNINCWPSLVLIGPNSELLLLLRGEGHLDLLSCFIEETISFMKKKNCFSNHRLPQIQVTDQLTSFGPLAFPGKITYYKEEKLLAISDSGHHRILILDEKGNVKYIIGGLDPDFKDGDFISARFNSPQGLVFKDAKSLYVADNENHAIREINLTEKYVKTVAGNGKQGADRAGGNLWNKQEISSPWDVCFSKNTSVLFIAMAGHHQIWALFLDDDDQTFFKKGIKGECKAVAGSGREENRNNCYPHAAGFAQPSGLTYSVQRHSLFIADSESSSVRELNLSSGKVSSVVGGNRNPMDLFAFGDEDGCGFDVKLQHPLGVAWDTDHDKLYVADSYNHKIKAVDLKKNNACVTVKLNTEFNEPAGLCVFNNSILVVDTNNSRIKLCDANDSTVTPFPVILPEIKIPQSINAEKSILVNKRNGRLIVNLEIIKPVAISFTENAPSCWTITFADKNWKKLISGEKREEFEPSMNIEISLPNGENEIKVLISGQIYTCKNSVCTMEKLLYVVHVEHSDTACDRVTCEFSHSLSN